MEKPSNDDVASALSAFTSGRRPVVRARPLAASEVSQDPGAAQAEPHAGAAVEQSAEADPAESPELPRPKIKRPPPPQPFFLRVGFKRTLIPPLLTTGVCMLVVGSIKYVAPVDTPFTLLPWWFAATFLGIAPLMLILGIITMLQVKHQLEAEKAKPPTSN